MVSQELLLNFPESDRLLIIEEAMADPAFGDQLSQVLSQEGGVKAVALCMRHAVVNEMNPRLYPESKGMWPVLRKTVVAVAQSMPDIVEKELAKLPLETLTEMLKMVAAGKSPFVAVSGMGQFDFGGLLTSVINAGAKLYETRLVNTTQTRIANIQAGAATATLDAQIKIANAQTAIAEAQARQATESSIITKDIGGGIPFWTIPIGLLVAGLGVLIYFKTRG
jgi:hypothetical protein